MPVLRRSVLNSPTPQPTTRVSPFDLPLDEGRHLINVGAVGQPPDGDARAAFVFYDTDTRTVTILRTGRAAESAVRAHGAGVGTRQ